MTEQVSEAVTTQVAEKITFLQWFWQNVLWKPGTGAALWGLLVRLLFALLVWKLGTVIIRKITRLAEKPGVKVPMDKTMQRFMLNLLRALLYALLVIAVVAIVGVPMASVTAVIASAGVTLGLAMQGSLSNLAGGIMLTLARPFRIGDYIETGSVGGTVGEISLFYTVLISIDNKKITVPNGSLMNANITNYSAHEKRRLDMTFLVGREADIAKVLQLLRTEIEAEKAVLLPPDAPAAPFVALTELKERGQVFTLRVWCKTKDYWDLNYALTGRIAEAFQREHIALPAQSYRALTEKEAR